MQTEFGEIPHCAKIQSIALLMRRRIPNSRELISTFWSIVRSCIFLISHGVGYSATTCLLRKIVGKYNFYTASFIPCFLSSIVAILIERPSRRPLLSLYVTNVVKLPSATYSWLLFG